MQVQEMKVLAGGSGVSGFFLIRSANLKITQANAKYLDLVLADQSGEINSKLWDCSEEDMQKFQEHMLVKVKGSMILWQGKPQLKIERIRLAEAKDEVDLADYVPVAPEKPDVMWAVLEKTIDGITNRDIQMILRQIIGEAREKLMYYPAAKQNHHAVRSGLLFHIKTMLAVGEKLSEIYPWVDRDLLNAGIILHDIAKIAEMEAGPVGLIIDYSMEGQLLGHIIQGIKWIDRAARQTGADEEVSLLLQHMVLSHHYEPEFGSPKLPMIPEAELLHYIDMIDARMFDMEKNLANIQAGAFSDKVWVLNRRLYKAVSRAGLASDALDGTTEGGED